MRTLHALVNWLGGWSFAIILWAFILFLAGCATGIAWRFFHWGFVLFS